MALGSGCSIRPRQVERKLQSSLRNLGDLFQAGKLQGNRLDCLEQIPEIGLHLVHRCHRYRPPRPDSTSACWFCVACVEDVRAGTDKRSSVYESRALQLAASEELPELGVGAVAVRDALHKTENLRDATLDFTAGRNRWHVGAGSLKS